MNDTNWKNEDIMQTETTRERYYRESEELRAQMFDNQPDRADKEIQATHEKISRYSAYEKRIARIRGGYTQRGLEPLRSAKSEVDRLEKELAEARLKLAKTEKTEAAEKRGMERWLDIAKTQYEQAEK